MQTAANKVEMALMHILEADPSYADLGAMCQKNPLHTFMFDSHGKLLNANKAAFEAFESDPPGEPLPFLCTPCPALSSHPSRQQSCFA